MRGEGRKKDGGREGGGIGGERGVKGEESILYTNLSYIDFH